MKYCETVYMYRCLGKVRLISHLRLIIYAFNASFKLPLSDNSFMSNPMM